MNRMLEIPPKEPVLLHTTKHTAPTAFLDVTEETSMSRASDDDFELTKEELLQPFDSSTNNENDGYNNNQETTTDSDDDEEDDHVDRDASIKSIRRLAPNGMRRNASMESFLTRSQRALLLGKDPPPSVDEARSRVVQFSSLDPVVHIIPRVVDEALLDKMFLNDDDFDRMDADMKITHFRWQNHVAGKIPFDASKNTMRGLEFLHRDEQMARDLEKYRHCQMVLGECLEQKSRKPAEAIDWESIRRVSLLRSSISLEKAAAQGVVDERERRVAWDGGKSVEEDMQNVCNKEKPKKKPKSRFLFWKK